MRTAISIRVYSLNTIYFWPDPNECLGKIYRILKPGGSMVLAFGDKDELEQRSFSPEIFRFYSVDEVKEMLIRIGFNDDISRSSRGSKAHKCHCVKAVK